MEQRYQLIQGLMDTDGTVDNRGRLTFSSSSKRLAEDFMDVVRSLGAIASMQCKTPYYKKNDTTIKGLLHYSVNFNATNKADFVSLARKRNRITNSPKSLHQLTKKVESIEYIGNRETKCIYIDHPSHLYVTDGYTITHNTFMTAAFVDLYNKNNNFRCLVIVPNKDLINQTSADIAAFGVPVGRYYGDVKEPNEFNVVSTWQSLQNNPELVRAFQVIIVDECHGAAGNVIKSLLLDYGNESLVRIGLTGTLPKEPAEAMSVKYVLGDVQYTVPARELIDKGWLAKLNLHVRQLVEDLTPEWNYFKEKRPADAAGMKYKQFKRDFFPDYPAEKNYLQKAKPRIEYIANMVEQEVKKTGNAFVLVNNIPFGKKLADSIENAYFVYGQDESEVRKKIYALFAEHDDVVVVSTFQLASTGLNIKRIFNLFLIDAGKSFIQIIQSIGRGLRKAKDKDTVNVWDVCGDLKFGQKHLKEREKYYDEQKYKFDKILVEYTKSFDMNSDAVVY